MIRVFVAAAVIAALLVIAPPPSGRVPPAGAGEPSAFAAHLCASALLPTLLPTLGGDASWALDMNDDGIVVGAAENSSGDHRAVRWNADGEVLELDGLGGSRSVAVDVNNAGQAAGYATIADPQAEEIAHAVVWDAAGNVTDLGVLDQGGWSYATAINESGAAAGYAGHVPEIADPHAIYWSGDEQDDIEDLGALGEDGPSYATDINDSGVVVGMSGDYLGDSSEARAFVWDGSLEELETAADPDGSTQAFHISNAGVVVGNAFDGATTRPAIWDAEGALHLPSSEEGAAVEVNGSGSAVGFAGEDPQSFQSSDPYEMIDELTEGVATDINDSGMVAGVQPAGDWSTEFNASRWAVYGGLGLHPEETFFVPGPSLGFVLDDNGAFRQYLPLFRQGLVTSAINSAGDVAGTMGDDVEEPAVPSSIEGPDPLTSFDPEVAEPAPRAFVKQLAPAGLEDFCWEVYGLPPNVEALEDPVNSATGAFVDSRDDLAGAVPSTVRGFDLVSRTYSTLNAAQGIFGLGWTSSVESRVEPVDADDLDGTDVLVHLEGRRARFESTGVEQWKAPDGLDAELVFDPSAPAGESEYRLVWDDGEVWRFHEAGQLAEIDDDQGQVVQVEWYDDMPTVTNLTTGHEVLFLDDDGDGLVDAVEASDGTSSFAKVWYGYFRGFMASVSEPTDSLEVPAGRATIYEPDVAGRIARIEDSGENLIVSNEYDLLGRVATQLLPSGDEVTFSYGTWDDATSTWVTTATYSSSGEVFAYHHSEAGELISVSYEISQEEFAVDRSWDDWRPGSFTDRRDAEQRTVYEDLDGDGRGDRPRMTVLPDPATGVLPAVSDPPDPDTQTGAFEFTWYWDESDAEGVDAGDLRVWKHRDATGAVIEYSYEGDEQIPEWVIDPTGRVTCIDSTDGLVARRIDGGPADPAANDCETGEVITDFYYGDGDPDPEIVCPPRLLCSQVVAPGAGVESKAVYGYDAAGRVATVTEAYGSPAAGGSPGATTTTYTYDAAGRLLTEVSPRAAADHADNGRYDSVFPTSYGYDSAGRVSWVSDEGNDYEGPGTGGPGHPSVSYTYTPDGQVDLETTTLDLATGETTVTDHDYNASGDLIRVTDGYDPDPDGDGSTVTETEVGELGRIESVTVAPGTAAAQTTSYVYDDDGNQTQRTTAEGTWGTGYDFWGRVLCEADPLDVKAFLGDGNLDCGNGSSTYSAVYEYDNAGRQTRVVRAPGEGEESETEYVYDEAGRLLETWGESGVVADSTYRYGVVEERAYDAAGRVEDVIALPPDAVVFDWDTGSGHVVTSNAYDAAGRLEETVADVGGIAAETSYTYDAHGWLLSEISPEGRMTSYGYDAAGNVLLVTRPHEDSETVSRARQFTPEGQLAAETDFAAAPVVGTTATRSFTYNDAGWLTEVSDPLGTVAQYGYDDRGNRISRTSTRTAGAAPNCGGDPEECIVEEWGYDPAGQLVSHTFPRNDSDDATVEYGYDAAGRQIWMAEPVDGSMVRCETTSYDGHRVDQVDYWAHGSSCSGPPASFQTVSYGYDGLDRRTLVTDTRGGVTEDTTYGYDEAGRLASRVDGHNGQSNGWWWTDAGLPRMLAYNGSWAPVRFAHDDLGRLTNTYVELWGVPIPYVEQTWDVDGLLVREDLNDSTAKYRAYDYYGSGQLDTYEQAFVTADVVETHLTWWEDGRVESECTDATVDASCSGATEDHIYDSAGQLRGVGAGCEFSGGAPDGDCDYAYTYDGHGNHTAKTTPDGAYTYAHDRADRLSADTQPGGVAASYTYDYAGRVTAIDTDDAGGDLQDETYTYAPTGRIAEYERAPAAGDTAQWTFTHDADGNLAHTDIDNNADETVDATIDNVWGDVHGIPQAIATVIDWDGPGGADPYRYRSNYGMRRVEINGGWFAYDWQGSVLASTSFPDSPTGYEPFGAPEDHPETYFGYRGELHLAEAYIYLRNRNYDPTTGTFLTEDPMDGVDGTPTVANAYHYADNDPLNKVDPLGLRPSDLQMQHCNTNAMGQCPVVVNDVSNSFRAGTDEYVVPGRGLDCFVATDSAAHVAEASLAVGIDTRLVFGVYLQETTSCRRPGVDRIANTLGQLGSVGPSNLPASSFAATVYRNPQRFGFASASDVSTGWLMDRFQEMAHRGGIGDYNAAYATASRLKDIVDDLGEARRQRGVRLITRSQAQSLSQDPNFRVYRESALVGQAYTSVRNNSLRFFIDLFTYGDVGRIDENGIDALGESGYSNGFDATCSTFPFRC